MRMQTCSECRASLDADAIKSTGVWECPYCGQPLPDEPAEIAVVEHPADGIRLSSVGDRPPGDSRIELHEATDQRLVVYVPPGGKSASGLGVFAVLWNGFMTVFTGIWFAAGVMEVMPLAIIVLFWLVGIGMVVGWIKLKYERTLLLVEPSRAVVQHILFNRKKQLETKLFSQSEARLVEAYSQNDVPVYSVAITGEDRTIRFGTSLSNAEKDWLVDRINLLIAPHLLSLSDAVQRDGEGASPDEEPLSDMGGELPEGIHVTEDNAEQLSFWIPAVTFAAARWGIMIVAGVFSAVWLSGVSGAAVAAILAAPDMGFRIVVALFFSLFGAAGLMPLGMSLFAWQGRISVSLNRELLSVRWHVGPFGRTRTIPTADIINVRTRISTGPRSQPRNARDSGTAGPQCAVVTSRDDKTLLLTFLDDDSIVRHVSALVKRKWQSFFPTDESQSNSR